MSMSEGIFRRISVIAAVLLGIGMSAGAQTYGSYTPYSMFGVGDTGSQGTAFNKTMGGVGIATRNNKFINVMNPAAVTARDSLAFMADFSVYADNKVFTQGDMKSASNTLNIESLSMSFPIWRSSAFAIGVMPFSNTGFGYSTYYTDPSVIGRTGNIQYTADGQGGIYQAYLAAGVTFWKRLSLGAEYIYHFGSVDKEYQCIFSDSSYNSLDNGNMMTLNASAGKFGVQYAQPIGSKAVLTVGATYKTKANLRGYVDTYSLSSGTAASDTLYYKVDTLGTTAHAHLASEKGIGISFRYGSKWMIEFDYTRSDWSDSNLNYVSGFAGNTVPAVSGGKSFSAFIPTLSESYRVGFEYVPNINDIRYYMNTVAYRGGAYYRKEYYLVDGHPVVSAGITLGMTLPVFRWSNGITLGMELGQRGTTDNNLIRERYVNFSVGFNLYDIWFQKSQYR